MSDLSLSQTFANLAAPPEVPRLDPKLLNTAASPRYVINGISIQQAYGDVLPQLHAKAGLPDQLPISLLTRDDLELIYGKPIHETYAAITNPDKRAALADVLISYYKDQGIDIKKTPDSIETINRILQDLIQGEATSQMPTVDIPLCIISFDSENGKLLLKDSFLGVSGISDPEYRIKINPSRLEESFTLVHEAAHCHQTGHEQTEISFQAEREADRTAHRSNPAETQLFYRARMINGIHHSAIQTILFPEAPDLLDHATEVDLIDTKKFPVISSQDLTKAYQEIGTALTQERILSGVYDTPAIREKMLAVTELKIEDTNDATLKEQLSTLQDQLKTSAPPFSELYKNALSHNFSSPSLFKNALIYLAPATVKASPFLQKITETTLGDTAPLVAKLLDGPEGKELSPLAKDLLTLYTNAAADVQPDVEPYRRPLPPGTRNPFTEDISAFMIQPAPVQLAHVNKTKLPKKVSPQKKSPAAQ